MTNPSSVASQGSARAFNHASRDQSGTTTTTTSSSLKRSSVQAAFEGE